MHHTDSFIHRLHLIPLLVQIFEGSWDSNTSVTHYFYKAVVAQYVRIVPQTWNGAIAIRFEILGCNCKYTNGKGHPLSEVTGMCLELTVPAMLETPRKMEGHSVYIPEKRWSFSTKYNKMGPHSIQNVTE